MTKKTVSLSIDAEQYDLFLMLCKKRGKKGLASKLIEKYISEMNKQYLGKPIGGTAKHDSY